MAAPGRQPKAQRSSDSAVALHTAQQAAVAVAVAVEDAATTAYIRRGTATGSGRWAVGVGGSVLAATALLALPPAHRRTLITQFKGRSTEDLGCLSRYTKGFVFIYLQFFMARALWPATLALVHINITPPFFRLPARHRAQVADPTW